ncbi:tetraacyldisaccharide 4'-kinase [uncultured Vibrio sp.]|uniref:tetraacyldisaccharide 4'-kinase n=1 Tax=uncultured Vibrio sp. TaxID=114054 RepID=UPI0025FDBE40|nr:tetraacyldisaccharide 4'-kinase [uncultured Vibrio sp.]
MIEKIWFQNHQLKYLLWPLLWPLSLLFGKISRQRRRAFESGSKPSYRPPVPVVVVGNITAGGNGKTPVVIWLVEKLVQQGYKPGVVSRGYGAKAPNYPLIVEDDTPTAHCGDEPKLIKQRTHVPVAVSPVRSEAVKVLLSHGVDIVITDDGLQHYALQRDVELVIVDGVRRFGNEQLIPLGPLREKTTRLEQVDFIVTNGGAVKGDEISMTLSPDAAINLVTGKRVPVKELDQLVAFAGIGHPPRFFNTLEKLEADLVLTKGFADHQAFKQQELETLSVSGSNMIMTEKDAVKCREFAKETWWYLPVSAEFEPANEQRIMDKLKEVLEQYGSSSI